MSTRLICLITAMLVAICITLAIGSLGDGIIWAAHNVKWEHADGVQWETLLTGAFALGGAFLTVWIISRQIGTTERLDFEQRKRRERAARALLPQALSELMNYAKSVAPELITVRNLLEKHNLKVQYEYSLPPIADFTSKTIKMCIEFAEEPFATALEEIPRHIQIACSRLDGCLKVLALPLGPGGPRGGRIIVVENFNTGIRDMVKLYTLSSALMIYARGEEKYRLINQDDLRNSFFLMELLDEESRHQSWIDTFDPP